MIAERYNVSARRADLIARDQMGTLASKISQAKQQAAGAMKYIWRTSEDERVVGAPGNRSKPNERHGDHYARNGKLFTWDRPPHDGHPGEAINCRCTAEPVWDDEAVDAQPADESDLKFDPVRAAAKAAKPKEKEEIDFFALRAFDSQPYRNQNHELTDGVYRVSPQKAKKHAFGHATPNDSYFSENIDAELIALEAAKIADLQGLWPNDGQAIVIVDMGRIIGFDVRSGEWTRFMKIRRKRTGVIHGNPERPRRKSRKQ